MSSSHGTCCFVSIFAAQKFYAQYGCTKEDVAAKIKNGEVHLGAPHINDHQTFYSDVDGRYVVVTHEEKVR